MTIIATTPLSEGSKCYGSFTFSDGATVRSSGGLICSEHGRRHCRHHKLAHAAIIAKAASHKAATAKPLYCPNCGHAYTQAEFEAGYDARWSAPENFYLPCCGADGWASLTTIPPRQAPEPDLPLLLDVAAEVAVVEAQMEAEGFTWSEKAQTWVRQPTMAQRAAAALPADHVPETFSIYR